MEIFAFAAFHVDHVLSNGKHNFLLSVTSYLCELFLFSTILIHIKAIILFKTISELHFYKKKHRYRFFSSNGAKENDEKRKIKKSFVQ